MVGGLIKLSSYHEDYIVYILEYMTNHQFRALLYCNLLQL